MLLGPHYIPNSLHIPLPSYPLIATLFFTLSYILSILKGIKTAASRRPLLELDNCPRARQTLLKLDDRY